VFEEGFFLVCVAAEVQRDLIADFEDFLKNAGPPGGGEMGGGGGSGGRK
jgi:hypothetical protein